MCGAYAACVTSKADGHSLYGVPSYAEADRVVGKVAHVSVPIPGGGKAGEVVVRIRGGSEAYIAYAEQRIDVGSEVVVLADLGARSVSVAPL